MAKAAAGTVKRRKRTSPKEGGVNKAQIDPRGGCRNRRQGAAQDIIAVLAIKGITVSSPQVSSTLKAAGYRRSRRGKRGAAAGGHAAASNGHGMPSLDHLLAAKALVAKLGSVEAAKKAIEVLGRLS